MSRIKNNLKAGGIAIGTTAGSDSEVRFLAGSGFDFLLFDTQHAPDTVKGLAGAVAAMRGREAMPIIRVPESRADEICFALDVGARGIVAPMINTRSDAENLVRWCKYPFEGVRSSSGVHGEWGEFASYREYMDAVNRDILILPMIETAEAMENLDAIASVPGVDVLLIGPSDLSICLGVPLEYTHPKYLQALDRIAAACSKANITAGAYFLPPGFSPADFAARGFRLFTMPWAGWAKDGIGKGLAALR